MFQNKKLLPFCVLSLSLLLSLFTTEVKAATFTGLKSDLQSLGITNTSDIILNILGPLVQEWLGDFFEEDKSLSQLDFSAAGIKSAHILIAQADGQIVKDVGKSSESSVNFGLKELTAQSPKWSGTTARISGFQKSTAFTDPMCVGDLNNYNTFSGVNCTDKITLHQKPGDIYLDTTIASTFGFVFSESAFLIDGQEGSNILYQPIPEPAMVLGLFTNLVFFSFLKRKHSKINLN